MAIPKYPCPTCGGTGAVPNCSSSTGASKCLDCKGSGRTNEAPRKRGVRVKEIIDTLFYQRGNFAILFEQYKDGSWMGNGDGFPERQMTNLEVMNTTNQLMAEGWVLKRI